MKMLRLEGNPPITKWEVFKNLIKSHFYPTRYEENQLIHWHYFWQNSRKTTQEYTNEFRKQVIMMGISPTNLDVLLKYLGSLHNHLKRHFILFKPKTIDETYV